jgi:hypothetical protein
MLRVERRGGRCVQTQDHRPMDYIIGQSRPGGPGAPGTPARQAPGPGLAGGEPADAAIIIDGDQNSFMVDVIEDSQRVPVLVDFWATWCRPWKRSPAPPADGSSWSRSMSTPTAR